MSLSWHSSCFVLCCKYPLPRVFLSGHPRPHEEVGDWTKESPLGEDFLLDSFPIQVTDDPLSQYFAPSFWLIRPPKVLAGREVARERIIFLLFLTRKSRVPKDPGTPIS